MHSIAASLQSGRLRLPAIVINGTLRYAGLFSPTFIQRDLKTLIADDSPTHERPSTTVQTAVADDYLKRIFARSVANSPQYWGYSSTPSTSKRE